MKRSRAVYRHADLRRLIEPQVVAVVGASSKSGSFGQRTLANLARFSGRVYGVNPKSAGELIAGVQSFPSVRELPETPDCVVLAVGGDLVPSILEECAERGVGGAIVYASGFAEVGTPEGIAAQERIASIGQAGGVRILGPNCLGLINTRLAAGLHFVPSFPDMELVPGPVSLVSQAGGFGYGLVQGMKRGIGLGHFLSAGNSVDVDICDLIAYLADEPNTKVIAGLFEGVKDGNRFLEAAELARDRGKPVVVCKTGNSQAAREVALSHTGTLVGTRAAYAAAFERAGVISLDHMDGLLETSKFLAGAGEPRAGKGVGVLAASGGAAVSMADKAEQYGVGLPKMATSTSQRLRSILPGFGSIANPADLTAEVLKTGETFVGCLDAFASDPSFDAVVIPFTNAGPESAGVRAPMVNEVARRTGTPMAAVWLSDWLAGPGSEVFDADPSVPLFRSADHCFEAIAHWLRWHEQKRSRAQVSQEPRLSARSAKEHAKAALSSLPANVRTLDELTSKQVLAAYGIGILKEKLATTIEEAVLAADAIGYPVALKIVSPDISHKTEVGGVELLLSNASAVRQAFDRVVTNVRRNKPEALIDGVVVQQMITGGSEMVLGARIDPQFGPLVAVGFGGTLVEILRDTTTRLAPIDEQQARQMLGLLKGYPLLQGYRGSPAANISALAQSIARFSEFVADNADLLAEVDVNPLVVNASQCVCIDALIVRNQ